MITIIPHLWFDREAKEAAEFYASIFPNSKITNIVTMRDTPSGDAEIVSFELSGMPFMAISAGPLFKFNPSISFIVNFDSLNDKDAKKNLQNVWNKLSAEGKELMPLDEYPFSKFYGWIEDKYGLSWQLILSNPQGEKRPFIMPSLLFTGEESGKAEEAINFYLSVFENSAKGMVAYYPKGMEPDREGTVMYSDFMLENYWFSAMDSAREGQFAFNESISFILNCNLQEEMDYYWGKLSAVKESEQCGWLKDKYGVSWQVSPSILDEFMRIGTREQVDRMTQAILPMKKIDVMKIKEAFDGNS